MGLHVGGPGNRTQALDGDRVEGIVRVSPGATVYITGGCNSDLWWYSQGYGHVLGLGVGYAANTTIAHADRPYVGCFYTQGTVKTDLYPAFFVGAGYGQGTYVQDGGTSTFNLRADPAVFGCAGGKGELIVSNGTFEVCEGGKCYFGGCPTNEIVNFGGSAARTDAQYTYAYYGWPATLRNAEGKLTLVGGSFQTSGTGNPDVILGADGTGTIEIHGGATKCEIEGRLVLSNATTYADQPTAGASKVRFVATAAEGLKPIKAGSLVVTDAARFEVDLTARPIESRVKLFDTANVVTASGVDVTDLARWTIAPNDGTRYQIFRTGDGIYLRPRRGFAVFIK